MEPEQGAAMAVEETSKTQSHFLGEDRKVPLAEHRAELSAEQIVHELSSTRDPVELPGYGEAGLVRNSAAPTEKHA